MRWARRCRGRYWANPGGGRSAASRRRGTRVVEQPWSGGHGRAGRRMGVRAGLQEGLRGGHSRSAAPGEAGGGSAEQAKLLRGGHWRAPGPTRPGPCGGAASQGHGPGEAGAAPGARCFGPSVCKSAAQRRAAASGELAGWGRRSPAAQAEAAGTGSLKAAGALPGASRPASASRAS